LSYNEGVAGPQAADGTATGSPFSQWLSKAEPVLLK